MGNGQGLYVRDILPRRQLESRSAQVVRVSISTLPWSHTWRVRYIVYERRLTDARIVAHKLSRAIFSW
jgi:hypothetical protein